jgi:hypothetical protein
MNENSESCLVYFVNSDKITDCDNYKEFIDS